MPRRWLKASVASAAAQLTRMTCGLLVLKIVIIQLGVDGVGRLGHFMNLLSILYVFAGGGITIGISKYVAEHEKAKDELASFLSSAWSYSLLASGLIAIAFTVGAGPLSRALFGDGSFRGMIMFVGAAQFAFAYINYATGVINGLRETQAFSRITVIGCIVGVIPCYFLVSRYRMEGAVVALVLVQGCMLFPAAWEFHKLFNRLRPAFAMSSPHVRNLSKFGLMQFFSVATMPVVEMYIRTELSNSAGGWELAGTWQGVQRLSYAALSLFTSFLAVYYMPTLSGMTDRKQIVRYVLKMLAAVIGVYAVAACGIFLLRDIVFALFLSRDFAISPGLLALQLAGDLFRIASYVVGFLSAAKAATKLYVLAELVQSALYVGLFTVISHQVGGDGVFPAYAASNLAYLTFCLIALYLYAKASSKAST